MLLRIDRLPLAPFTPKVEWFQQSYQARGDDTLYERLANLSLSVTFQPGR